MPCGLSPCPAGPRIYPPPRPARRRRPKAASPGLEGCCSCCGTAGSAGVPASGQTVGAEGGHSCPRLVPNHTLPATSLAYLAAIRAHRAALHLGQWRGAHPLVGREVEWDIIWPFQGHWPCLWGMGVGWQAESLVIRGPSTRGFFLSHHRLDHTLLGVQEARTGLGRWH